MPVTEMYFKQGIFFSRKIGRVDEDDASVWGDSIRYYALSYPTPIVALIDAQDVTAFNTTAHEIFARVSFIPGLRCIVIATSSVSVMQAIRIISLMSREGSIFVLPTLDQAQHFARELVIDSVLSARKESGEFDAPETNRVCPSCGRSNPPETVVCASCGTDLESGRVPDDTRHVLDGTPEDESRELLRRARDRQQQHTGNSVFHQDMQLRIEVMMSPSPILVTPAPGRDVVLGRFDPDARTPVDVDLIPYAAYPLGVSRNHAAIRLVNKHLEVRDLGSANGTYVNGVCLEPGESEVLFSGDTLQLGKMVLRVHFE